MTGEISNLEEVLSLLFPSESSEPYRKKRPEASLRASLMGEEGEAFENVPLSLTLHRPDQDLILRGTADRIVKEGDLFLLEEEVAAERFVDFNRHRPRHLLRARILALALMLAKKTSRVRIRLSVFAEGRMEKEEEIREQEEISRLISEEVRQIFSLSPLWEKPAVSIAFPYTSLRDGQKELIHAVWDAIKSRSGLMACAPTGIGKTLAVLYPALRALETGKASKVFYASPKNTLKLQAMGAVEALQKIRSLRTLVLGSRISLCPENREECLHRDCPLREEPEKRLAPALAYLSAFSCITEKELRAASQLYRICPFELAKKIHPFCQVVIGDYNHLFDPATAIFPAEKEGILLVDEAHNLPNRIRENYTQGLSPEDLDFFFRDSSACSRMLREHFAPLTAEFCLMTKKREESKEYFSFSPPEALAKAVEALLPKLGFALHGGFGLLTEETRKQLRELYGKCKKFSLLFRMYDEDFATLYPPEGGCRIYLVNPKRRIGTGAAGWRSTVFFSATLLPKEYYFDLLGGTENDRFLVLSSPFPKENLFVGICPVDVSYSNRFQTAKSICSIIRSATRSKEGNYMVFLPSFDYLNLVSQEYKRPYFDDSILIQERVMTAKKRTAFLKAFEKGRKGVLIGFCVLGGIFSEGIDLKGDSLSGEIIVGTGFPPPSPEAEAECASYYKRDMDGKSFAYTLPGWSRVLQAAGRVIRSEEDRGFLILCDSRYRGEDIRELFPEGWENAEILERESALRQELERFWR